MSIQFKLNSSAQPIAQQSQSSHVAQIHPHATETSSFSKMKKKVTDFPRLSPITTRLSSALPSFVGVVVR